MQNHIFKLALVGDGGVGKSSFVRRHATGEFTDQYTPTMGADVIPLNFRTTTGETITFNVWDMAGQDKFSGMKDGYFIQSDCAMIMFDTQSRFSYKNTGEHAKDVKRICADIPIVVCGNKVDIPGRQVKPRNISIHRVLKCDYYDISVKSNFNFEKPFLSLARKLLNNRHLEFI